MKRCRTSVWIASVLLFTVVVSSIFPIRTVSAHGVHDHSHEESVEHVALPKGAVIWEGEDFGSWLSTASVSTAHSQNAQWALVFTSESDYQDWLNSISPEAAELIVNLTMRVKGSKLPNVIVGAGSQNEPSSIEVCSETEYIIILADEDNLLKKFCQICGAIAVMFAYFLLERWAFEPFARRIELWWKEFLECLDGGHIAEENTAIRTTQCPYRTWCGGTWMEVLSDWGTGADCACECGAVWTVWNPLD
jgi:hypothetical protein